MLGTAGGMLIMLGILTCTIVVCAGPIRRAWMALRTCCRDAEGTDRRNSGWGRDQGVTYNGTMHQYHSQGVDLHLMRPNSVNGLSCTRTGLGTDKMLWPKTMPRMRARWCPRPWGWRLEGWGHHSNWRTISWWEWWQYGLAETGQRDRPVECGTNHVKWWYICGYFFNFLVKALFRWTEPPGDSVGKGGQRGNWQDWMKIGGQERGRIRHGDLIYHAWWS